MARDARDQALRADLEQQFKVPALTHPALYHNRLKIRLTDGRIAVILLSPYWSDIVNKYGYGPYGLPAVCCDAAAMNTQTPFVERFINVWVGEAASTGFLKRVRIKELGTIDVTDDSK